MSQMAAYSQRNGRTGLGVDMKEPCEGQVTKTECEGEQAVPRSSKDSHEPASAADSSASGGPSFSFNHNSVVCLPLVSEGLKLVWTQSDQTRELDAIAELVQAFNLFPYPTSREVSALARVCALPLDKVKVWFMVQRIKYGISWASEEIEETRRKLSITGLSADCAEPKEEAKVKSKRKGCEEVTAEDEDSDQIEVAVSTFVAQKQKPKYESPETYKPAKSTAPCFSSSLPPPQDSYYYRPPVDIPATTATDVSLDLSEPTSQQRRHGRYKKSKAQLAVLRSSFLKENWPAEIELRRLQDETGLSRNDIRKWFSDSRYQLRIGRGALGAAQAQHQTATGVKDEPQQLQPLPLIAQKSRKEHNGVEVQEGARNNGIKDSHFFQTFLSNSLEAFGGRAVKAVVEEAVEETADNGDHCEDKEDEEKPLQLTKTSEIQSEVPQQPLGIVIPSPSSSPSGTPPPPPFVSNKQFSNGTNTSKKAAHSTKASSSQKASSSSPSPSLTPAGRPRKTKEQLDVLKQHFLRCQWPKSEDYTQLVNLTGLPRADVIQWFGDTRYAVKNGQLRWVQGVREQFLAELALQQSSSGYTNGTGSSGTSRAGGSRKRKSQVNGTANPADSPDINPLEVYHRLTGTLHEKDLDSLCKKSRMSYQQVRDWFATQESRATDEELNVTD